MRNKGTRQAGETQRKTGTATIAAFEGIRVLVGYQLRYKCQKKIQSIYDVDGIKYVINFDYPQSSEDYIHRIGRTGRSQATGTSYAFFTKNNAKQSRALLQVLKEANQEINPKLEELARTIRGGDFGGNRRYGNVSRFGAGTFKKGSINIGGGPPRKFGDRFNDDRSNGKHSNSNGFRRDFSSGNSKVNNGYNSGQNPVKHTRFD